MITRVRVKNYRALRDIGVDLGMFHVLVGPNGSGKSTFLDVFAFVRDCLKDDPRTAVERRAGSVGELTFGGAGGPIEFQFEFDLGELVARRKGFRVVYDLAIASDDRLGVRVDREELVCFPRGADPRRYAASTGRSFLLIKKVDEGIDLYLAEAGEGVLPGTVGVFDENPDRFAFGADVAALGRLPLDRTRYPTAMAVREALTQEIRLLDFVRSAMARPCPPLEPDEFVADGRNLARVAARLVHPRSNGHEFDHARAKEEWVYHLRQALPDLEDIGWAQRPDDRSEYLKLRMSDGLEFPSWSLSEGTLRMLGLTLPAFLPPRPGILLVEEPENAVHPHALEIIVGALRSVPRAQVLVTTHSPLVVDLVGRDSLLVFGKLAGAVRIATAAQHPALQNWDGNPTLSALFSAGYLK